jgi:hypothetical protein
MRSTVLFLVLLSSVSALLSSSGCGGAPQPQPSAFRPVEEDDSGSSKQSNTTGNSSKQPSEEVGVEEPAKTNRSPNSSGTGGSKAVSGNSTSSEAKPKSRDKSPEGAPPRSKGKDPALQGPTSDKVRLLRSLGEAEPKGNTQQQKIQNFLAQMEERLEVAGEILNAENAPPEARDEALVARVQIAATMLQLQQKDAEKFLKQAAADLLEAHDPNIATLGRVQLYMMHVQEVLDLKPEKATEVVKGLQTLLDAGGSLDVFAQQVLPIANRLEAAGYVDDALDFLTLFGDHFAASEKPQEALMGKQVQVSALVGRFRSGKGDKAELGQQIMAKIKELLAETKSDPNALAMLQPLAVGQESDAPELSGEIYDLIEKTFGDHENGKVAELAKELVENGRKRLALVGKPLEITGVKLNGDAFDWSEYQGKPVYVLFWTLSDRSFPDLSRAIQLQDRYGKRGLKVVTVNLDKDRDQVAEFMQQQPQEFPLVIVVGEDAKHRAFQFPAAKACGLSPELVPFGVLIGADGKVLMTHARGQRLEEELSKLLPAPEQSEPGDSEKSDDDKPSPPSEQEPAEGDAK